MSDSVDRVFAHALQTVRKIPGTGSARPPPEASLRLYGLYKQSMEGDVLHVMPRPARPASAAAAAAPASSAYPNARHARHAGHAGRGTIATDTEKWDAWDAQRGLSRTEAKRRYITTLIETMHRYASATPEARELVAELEFVWDQIRSNVPSTHGHCHHSHPSGHSRHSGDDGDDDGREGLGIIPPNAADDGDDRDDGGYGDYGDGGDYDSLAPSGTTRKYRLWRSRVEKALEKMATELAALREQLESRRAERQARQRQLQRGWRRACLWLWLALCALARHLLLEAVLWGAVLLWMRRCGDGRAEEALRAVARFVRDRLRGLRLHRRR